MFRNGPATPGRFVFAPPGALHYRGFSNLWSRDWVSDEIDPENLGYGETLGNRQYANGEAFGPYPPFAVVGASAEISGGASYPLAVVREQVGGWDTRCWFTVEQQAELGDTVEMDVRNCHRQKSLAAVMIEMYADDTTAAENTFNAAFPGYLLTTRPNTNELTPGSLIAVRAEMTVVVIPGTTNFWQWASQGAWGIAGMSNFAYYSTLQTWFDAAIVLLRRIENAGADPEKPIVLCGHSYGGAVACILAAMFRFAQPEREIGVLTFGCPKPGDARLCALVNRCTSVHLVNKDDPVCYLPPSGSELDLVAWAIPAPYFARWRSWARPLGIIEQNEFGVRRDDPPIRDLYSLLFRSVRYCIEGDVPPMSFAHWPYEYWRRIICPAQPAPTPEPEVLMLANLDPDDIADLVDGDPITNWLDRSGYVPHWQSGAALPQIAAAWTVNGQRVAILTGAGALAPSDGLLIPHASELPLPGTSIFFMGGKSAAFPNNGPYVGRYSATVLENQFGLRNGNIELRAILNSVIVADPIGVEEMALYALRMDADTVEIWCNGSKIHEGANPVGPQLRIHGCGSWGTPVSTTRYSYLGELQFFGVRLPDNIFDTVQVGILSRWGLPIP